MMFSLAVIAYSLSEISNTDKEIDVQRNEMIISTKEINILAQKKHCNLLQ